MLTAHYQRFGIELADLCLRQLNNPMNGLASNSHRKLSLRIVFFAPMKAKQNVDKKHF